MFRPFPSSSARSFFHFPTIFFLLLLLLLQNFANAQNAEPSMSSCLQRCLDPITRLAREKSLSFMYRNYESVCEKLDWAANCGQTCQPEDRAAFFQFTTFYRIHCVDFEEELEEHLPCLREAAFKADVVCREQCVVKEPAEKLTAKGERQNSLCKNVECSSICYTRDLARACPEAKQTIIKLNVRIADEMRRLTRDPDYEKLSTQCQRVHDGEYMRNRMLEEMGRVKN